MACRVAQMDPLAVVQAACEGEERKESEKHWNELHAEQLRWLYCGA